MFKEFRSPLPGVDEYTAEQVSIPVGWWLSEQDRSHIASAVIDYDSVFRTRIGTVNSRKARRETRVLG
jgi:hypothetical protein